MTYIYKVYIFVLFSYVYMCPHVTKISFIRPLPHLSGTYIGKNIWIKNNTNATAYKE
jgi:hypothetical protein